MKSNQNNDHEFSKKIKKCSTERYVIFIPLDASGEFECNNKKKCHAEQNGNARIFQK